MYANVLLYQKALIYSTILLITFLGWIIIPILKSGQKPKKLQLVVAGFSTIATLVIAILFYTACKLYYDDFVEFKVKVTKLYSEFDKVYQKLPRKEQIDLIREHEVLGAIRNETIKIYNRIASPKKESMRLFKCFTAIDDIQEIEKHKHDFLEIQTTLIKYLKH